MANGRSRNLKDQIVVDLFLKELRVNAGLRQIDVATALGVQQSIVSKYEAGERRLDIIEIRDLCKIFNISLIEFIKDLENRLEGKNEADQ